MSFQNDVLNTIWAEQLRLDVIEICRKNKEKEAAARDAANAQQTARKLARFRQSLQRAEERRQQAAPASYTYLACGCGTQFRIDSALEAPTACPKCGGPLQQGIIQQVASAPQPVVRRKVRAVRRLRPLAAQPKQAASVEETGLKLSSIVWGPFWLLGTLVNCIFQKGRAAARRPSKPMFWQSIVE